MLAHRAHEKGIEIGATVSSELPELMSFDPARLRQVLFNVIGNAVKFTQAGGVFVRASLQGNDVLISVTDTGPGMTEEEQNRIFGEFEQGGTPVEKSAGTGLGLCDFRPHHARVRRLAHGGQRERNRQRIQHPLSDRHSGGRAVARRNAVLAGSVVLLLAPAGAARMAISETITTLGGGCHLVDRRRERA